MKAPTRIAALAAAFACLSFSSAQAQAPAPPVTVAKPLAQKLIDWDEYTGRFEAVRRVELRARVSGYLRGVQFEDGQLVKAGEPLFVIDQRPFEIALARAEAELTAAQAEQSRAQAQLTRAENLVASRSGSESTLDDRLAEKLRADAQVQIAEAATKSAQLDLDYTVVRAPFNGRISDSRIDRGNLVAAGETLLATIVSTDPVHLRFTASEADFLKYSRLSLYGDRTDNGSSANEVQARLLDEEGWPHKGALDFVANELDPNAGTIEGRAVFANEDGLLTPGLFARLRLVGSREYEAVLVPDEAVLSDQARKIVMLVDAEGLVSAQVVTLGPLHQGMRVIRSGLSTEDTVVVKGVQRARPGATVTPTPMTLTVAAASESAVD